jgi:hypothetical protein
MKDVVAQQTPSEFLRLRFRLENACSDSLGLISDPLVKKILP